MNCGFNIAYETKCIVKFTIKLEIVNIFVRSSLFSSKFFFSFGGTIHGAEIRFADKYCQPLFSTSNSLDFYTLIESTDFAMLHLKIVIFNIKIPLLSLQSHHTITPAGTLHSSSLNVPYTAYIRIETSTPIT